MKMVNNLGFKLQPHKWNRDHRETRSVMRRRIESMIFSCPTHPLLCAWQYFRCPSPASEHYSSHIPQSGSWNPIIVSKLFIAFFAMQINDDNSLVGRKVLDSVKDVSSISWKKDNLSEDISHFFDRYNRWLRVRSQLLSPFQTARKEW